MPRASPTSRNFSLGLGLGQGLAASALLTDRRTVAEGAFTAPVLVELAAKHQVAMPIVSAVQRLLQGAPASEIVRDLLSRPLTAEGQTPAESGPV